MRRTSSTRLRLLDARHTRRESVGVDLFAPDHRAPPAHRRLLVRTAGETFTGLLHTALEESEALGATLDRVNLARTYGTDKLSKQLQQVARVIGARAALAAERDVFHVRLGGFDTHTDVGDVLQSKLVEVDAALSSFVLEMRTQGVWGNVAVQLASEFGRTITSNGQGTDQWLAAGFDPARVRLAVWCEPTPMCRRRLSGRRTQPLPAPDTVGSCPPQWLGRQHRRARRICPMRAGARPLPLVAR